MQITNQEDKIFWKELINTLKLAIESIIFNSEESFSYAHLTCSVNKLYQLYTIPFVQFPESEQSFGQSLSKTSVIIDDPDEDVVFSHNDAL